MTAITIKDFFRIPLIITNQKRKSKSPRHFFSLFPKVSKAVLFIVEAKSVRMGNRPIGFIIQDDKRISGGENAIL
jgi:hypothetical protein